MRFLFVWPTAAPGGGGDGSAAAYSGGARVLRAAAEALAAAGHEVHLLYCSTKAELLYAAMLRGAMPSLAYSDAVEGVAVFEQGGVLHHVSLADAEASVQQQLSDALGGLMGGGGGPGSTAAPLPAAVQRLVNEARALAARPPPPPQRRQQQQQQQPADAATWVVLDADGSQRPLADGAASLMEACAEALGPSRLLLVVQNVHFLPLGPLGTVPRRPQLLAAWGRLGGAACVSGFVAKYVRAHAAPLGLDPARVAVAPPATWRVFGAGPFADVGAAAARRLPWQPIAAAHQLQQQQQPQQDPPVVCCLKVTPEKGGWLFLQMAALVPLLRFVGVCADARLLAAAAEARLPNLLLVPPAADVDELLSRMTVLVAPSIWAEAFGMVVFEAQLRGVPVLVSDQGGLAEAALGAAAAVLPVQPMLLPAGTAAAGGGAPSWAARVLPTDQPAGLWADAVLRLLGDRQLYEAASAAGRAAAAAALARQPSLLAEFEAWLRRCSGG